jgi:hypothetical protein
VFKSWYANISHVYYVIRSNYVMLYVGESVTLGSILGDIRNNDISFCGAEDSLTVLLRDIVFIFGKFGIR